MPRLVRAASDPLPIRAHLFGPVRLAVGETPLSDAAWSRRSARTLLLLLLSVQGHRLPRDQVMDQLWPDAAPESALNALYTALHVIRRTLEPNLRSARDSAYIDVRGGLVGVQLPTGSYVDVDAFRDAIARQSRQTPIERGDMLREAVAIYEGDLLAEEPYAEWAVSVRQRLQRDWRRAVLDLAELERKADRPLATVEALETLLATDPTDEAVHQALMQAHAAAGRRAEALLQYERCVRVLQDQLQAEPSGETRALANAIEAAPRAAPIVAQQHVQLPALPVPPTRLIGRTADVAAVRAMLIEQGERLVTIIGPGGIGKTRLAVAVAQDVSASFDGAVGFVNLASVQDPALVIPSIARVLGIRDRADRGAVEQLRDALYQREILLVLDNLEQVIAAAPEIAVLLEGNTGLRLLVTSRAPLELRAERRFVAGPLAVPDVGGYVGHNGHSAAVPADAVGALAIHDSVALFVDRVRAAVPGFTLTDTNARAVAEVCVRLEGVPLAIELAAVRCRHMTPAELLERLEPRLPQLTGGPSDLPSRLRTMHAAIAWSYDLLDQAERQMFRRLSVFVGGCALEAAENLAAKIDGPASGPARFGDGRTVRDVVAALADKSLVDLTATDGWRIRMFETIREFGLEQLADSGELAQASSVHAQTYLEMAEAAAPELVGHGQATWLARLEADHDNLRSAYELLLAAEDPHRVLRLCRALSRFWRIHGHYREGRSRVERALARPGSRDVTRARAMTTSADLAELQGDYDRAEEQYREALAIFSDCDDRLGMAEASLGLGAVAIGRSELPIAKEWTTQGLELFHAERDDRGTASALNYLATIAFQRGELDDAAHQWKECLHLLEVVGDDRARSIGLSNLGVLELERGAAERALAHHRAALDIARTLHDKWGATHSLINLGRVLVTVGQASEARVLLEEAVANCRDLGDPVREAVALQNLALAAEAEGDDHETVTNSVAASLQIAWHAGAKILAADGLEIAARTLVGRDPSAAARQLGAAETLREQTAAVRESADQPGYDIAIAALRSDLSPAELDAAWAAGSDDSFDDAMAAALSALRHRPPSD